MTLSKEDYRKYIENFDKMVQELDESDKKLVNQVLNRYKYRKDPYRMIEEKERKKRKKSNEWNKLKKETGTQTLLTEVKIDKTKEEKAKSIEKKK